MAGTVITTIDEFQDYLSGVSERAEHHAQPVAGVVLSIAGAVVLFKDRSSEITVMAVEGQKGNVMWIKVKDKRYALAYNHSSQTVEVRDRSTHGPARKSFNNGSTTAEIIDFFSNLP